MVAEKTSMPGGPKVVRKPWNAFAPPYIGEDPKVTVKRNFDYDGLLVEELSWQFPCGRPIQIGTGQAGGTLSPGRDDVSGLSAAHCVSGRRPTQELPVA